MTGNLNTRLNRIAAKLDEQRPDKQFVGFKILEPHGALHYATVFADGHEEDWYFEINNARLDTEDEA